MERNVDNEYSWWSKEKVLGVPPDLVIAACKLPLHIIAQGCNGTGKVLGVPPDLVIAACKLPLHIIAQGCNGTGKRVTYHVPLRNAKSWQNAARSENTTTSARLGRRSV